MNKMKLLYLYIPLCLVLLGSCREEFDDHYKTSGESTITENIVDILRADPQFSLFVNAIDRLDLATTIGKSAIYTCLAQTNEDVEAFLKSKNYTSIDEVPEDELAQWLNYHLIMGMYYRYDIEKKSNTIADPQTLSFYQSNASLKCREDSKHPGKYLRLYTSHWLSQRGDDYRYLHNKTADANAFLAEEIEFSDRYDIDASNGVIHILSAPLVPMPRADEAIARDTSLSILNSWLDRYVKYDIKGLDPDSHQIDTTKVKGYTFGADIAKENNRFTIVAPTNEAIRKLFGPFLEDNFNNSYDEIPETLVKSILNTIFVNNFWGMSDITRGIDPPNFFLSINMTYVRMGNDIEGTYAEGLPSSNAMIYKVNAVPTPPLLNSVEGGIHVNQSRYSQWGEMLTKGITGLTDPLQYKHPVRTILIQPDEVWPKFVSDYKDKELDTLVNVLYTSIILQNIQDGAFANNTYYNTSCGSIFYRDGTFTDYSGNTVNLLSKQSTWEGTNGSIYEIDGFLNPLVASDTNQTLYKMQLEGNDDYSVFLSACDMTGIAEKLKLAGSFQYTILAPTNQAMEDAGMVDIMDLELLEEFVQRHIIRRKIFTDGGYSGVITNMNGELLTIAGTWENFTVTDESGQHVNIVLDKSNRQANNGVLHCITTALKKKQ